jgi:hypothetical protein
MALFLAYAAGRKLYKDRKAKKEGTATTSFEEADTSESGSNQAQGDPLQLAPGQFNSYSPSSEETNSYNAAMAQCLDTSSPPQYTEHASPVSQYPYSPDHIGDPNASHSRSRDTEPLILPLSPVPSVPVSTISGPMADLKGHAVKDIGYFNPDPNGVFPVDAGDNVYTNIYSFTNVLRKKGSTPEFATLPQYIHMSLLGSAKVWYDTELSNVTRVGLQHSTVEDWCHFLEQRFSGHENMARISYTHATGNSIDTTLSSPSSPNQYTNAVISPATASVASPTVVAEPPSFTFELPASIPNAPGYPNPMEFSAELEGELPTDSGSTAFEMEANSPPLDNAKYLGNAQDIKQA